MQRQQKGRNIPLSRALLTGRRQLSLLSVATAVTFAAVLTTSPSHAQKADGRDWIETWTASPQPVWDPEFFAPINIPRP